LRPFPVTPDSDEDRERRKLLRQTVEMLSDSGTGTKQALLEALNPYAKRATKEDEEASNNERTSE
jgi:hypothetical protein